MVKNKIRANILGFYVGTGCNLHCKHCAGGNPRNMVISESVVDAVLANIDSICTLQFLGYEATLYKKQIQMILDKVIQNNISVNYMILHTNMAVYDEQLAKIFNDFRLNHTLNPDASVIAYSTDEYHFHDGFTKEKLFDNVKKYKEYIGSDLFNYNNLNQGLYLTGRSKTMTFDELNCIDEIHIKNTPMKKCNFKKECHGYGLICKGGINCVETPIVLTPNGYVFAQDMEGLVAVSENDYSGCIGNIFDNTLYDMVQAHIHENNIGRTYVFRDRHLFEWNFRHLIYKCLQLREHMLKSINNKERISASSKHQKEYALIKEYETQINLSENYTDDASYSIVLDEISRQIDSDYNTLKRIFELENRLDFDAKNQTKIIDLFIDLSSSIFDPDKFESHFKINYNVFISMWEAYYSMDIDRFKECIDMIENKLNGVE